MATPVRDDLRALIRLAAKKASRFGGATEQDDIASEALLRITPILQPDGSLEDIHELEKAVTNARKRRQRSAEKHKTVSLDDLPLEVQAYADPNLSQLVEREHWRGVLLTAARLIEQALGRAPGCGKPVLTRGQRAILAKKFGLDDLVDADALNELPKGCEALRKAEYRANRALLQIVEDEIVRRLRDPHNKDRAIWRDLYRTIHGVERKYHPSSGGGARTASESGLSNTENDRGGRRLRGKNTDP